MGFVRIGQNWRAKRLYGPEAGSAVLIRNLSWCWLEEKDGESELPLVVGECAVIEDAVMLEDDDGEEIPGGYERAVQWATLAAKHNLSVPQHLKSRSPKKRSKKAAKQDG